MARFEHGFQEGVYEVSVACQQHGHNKFQQRAAVGGTPDREALARCKVPPVEPVSDASRSRVEVSAATIAAFRGMLREESADTEFKLSERL